MIGYLQGKIVDLNMQECVLLTQSGVGYTVFINEIIYSKIALEEEVEIFIYHHRTENSENLFGFLNNMDKSIFTELIKISGVGGKVGMLILSLGSDALVKAVQNGDNKMIESVKGIGKKMAEKIILELKDKDLITKAYFTSNNEDSISKSVVLETNIANDIKNTLVNMGYNVKEVEKVLAVLPEGMEDIGNILPYCIRELS